MHGYTFSSIQEANLDSRVPRGHISLISDTDIADINNHSRNRGVDEIDFDADFATGISCWKDGKSTTKHTDARDHPEIDDGHRRVNWFRNAPGTPTMTILTSTRTHRENVCARLNQVLSHLTCNLNPILVTGRIALRHFDHAAYALNRPVLAECFIFWFRLVRWALQAWCDGTKWLEVRKLHMLPTNFAPGCVITLDTLGNCVVDQVFQVFYL